MTNHLHTVKHLVFTILLLFCMLSCGSDSVKITTPCADAQKCANAFAKAKTREDAAKAYELLEKYQQAYQEAAYKGKISDEAVFQFMDCFKEKSLDL